MFACDLSVYSLFSMSTAFLGIYAKVFMPLYHYERHYFSKECMKKELNMTAETRVLRILQRIDYKGTQQ